MVDSTTVHCADEESGLYQAILYEVFGLHGFGYTCGLLEPNPQGYKQTTVV